METALEWILTNSFKADMISYLSAHPEDFEEAIKLAIADKQPYSWRAAWLLWSCMEKNDQRIQRFVKNIIETISDKNNDQQRELLIILQQMEINKELEGLLYNHCVTVWEKITYKPSFRYNAFKVIIKIAQKHPDLSREIIFLTQDQYMYSLSPVVKKSISEMIKEINNSKH
jgi:hypothetical protein